MAYLLTLFNLQVYEETCFNSARNNMTSSRLKLFHIHCLRDTRNQMFSDQITIFCRPYYLTGFYSVIKLVKKPLTVKGD